MDLFEGYRISSPYGWRDSPINGKLEFHTGIDLVKPHQSPVYTFVAGTVAHAKEGVDGTGFGGYGIVVAVCDIATDHLHVYAHLDSALVKVGQQIERGQMIGRLGTTGQSTGPHLHYEIRRKSDPKYGWIPDKEDMCFDPTQYLEDLYRLDDIRSFKDVPKDHWCEPHLVLLKELGILEGHSDGTFRGDSTVTRYELAAIMANLYRRLK